MKILSKSNMKAVGFGILGAGVYHFLIETGPGRDYQRGVERAARSIGG